MNEETLAPIYQFGEGVVEGDDLTISREELRVPGFAKSISLELEHPFPDMADPDQ